MIDAELLPRVAKKIKTLRSNKNLTLADLSKTSHVSKGLLSKIENSRTTPSLPVFLGIVNALGVSLKDFFEGIDMLHGKEYLLIKKGDQQPLWREAKDGFSYRFLMAQSMPGGSVEIFVVTLQAEANSIYKTTMGYEFHYLLSGYCDYYFDEERIQLQEGDALYFDGTKPHLSVNRSGNNVVMLTITFLK